MKKKDKIICWYNDHEVVFTASIFQVEHFEEALTDVKSFQEINCDCAGTLAPYLMQLYYKVVSNCLKKHSARPASVEVLF